MHATPRSQGGPQAKIQVAGRGPRMQRRICVLRAWSVCRNAPPHRAGRPMYRRTNLTVQREQMKAIGGLPWAVRPPASTRRRRNMSPRIASIGSRWPGRGQAALRPGWYWRSGGGKARRLPKHPSDHGARPRSRVHVGGTREVRPTMMGGRTSGTNSGSGTIERATNPRPAWHLAGHAAEPVGQ